MIPKGNTIILGTSNIKETFDSFFKSGPAMNVDCMVWSVLLGSGPWCVHHGEMWLMQCKTVRRCAQPSVCANQSTVVRHVRSGHTKAIKTLKIQWKLF